MKQTQRKRTAAAIAIALALATGLGAGVTVEAQFASTGGPLWWMPENDGTWSRFHDVWHNSAMISNAAWDVGRQRGAATSFPRDTWVVTKYHGYTTNARANVACDWWGGNEIMNVGPPLDRNEYPTPSRDAVPPGGADPRKPDDRSGGLGGLQMSVHIGEWWQGLFSRAPPGQSYDTPDFWNHHEYGAFRVSTRTNGGAIIPAFDTNGPWNGFQQRPGMQLTGGGSGTGACIGAALVMMHGTENSDGMYPPRAQDADGNECFSQARLYVLRANTEARCEPDLRQENDMTEEFWDFWRGREQRLNRQIEVQYPGAGGPFSLIFPDSEPGLYPHYQGPYALMRRGEFALFTVGENAREDAAIQRIPWERPTYAIGTGTERRTDLEHFVDDTRPQPFGGKPMILRNNTGDTPGAEECLEIAPAGWDDTNGTFDPECPDPWMGTNRFTGVVNHENNGAGQTVRPVEVGIRDNREQIGVAKIRRLPGDDPPWTPADFGWFEHKKSPIACLMLRSTYNDQELITDFMNEILALGTGLRNERHRRWLAECPNREPRCSERGGELFDDYLEVILREVGLTTIYTWRYRTLSSLRTSLAMYDEIGPSGELVGKGRGAGILENNRCYTGPINEDGTSDDGYNEKLAATSSSQVPADEWMNPAWSGFTYWGTQMDEDAWYTSAGSDHEYHNFSEVRGAVTNLVEQAAMLRTGLDEPFPLDMQHEYGGPGIRRGSYTFREFSCPTAGHAGYYAQGVTRMGPQTLNHRDAPPGDAWKAPDTLIDPDDSGLTYPPGLPCVDEATSPVSTLTGDPLADYYNVRGVDTATMQPGEKLCYETRPATEHEVNDLELSPDALVPVTGEPGQWSNPLVNDGFGPKYQLEYSGDPATGPQPSEESRMRPTAYAMDDDSGIIRLQLNEWPMYLGIGMPSLDLERKDMGAIWAAMTPQQPEVRLQSEEVYEGVAPGFCPLGGCGTPPLDWGKIEYDGPIRFFGAGGIGGEGGCVLKLPTDPFDQLKVHRSDNDANVLSEGQSLVCLLPLDNHAVKPTGSCPRPGVGGGPFIWGGSPW